MKILSLDSSKNNTKNTAEKKKDVLEVAAEALASALSESLSEDHSFGEFESALLELSNEVSRRILSRQLEDLAEKYDAQYLLVDGDRYKRHATGTVQYHSLCGSMRIERYTYRKTGLHNGPTIVPMELSAGLVERATPALAFRAALGDAQCPGRQWEEQLRASHRRPPSRSTLERLAKNIGETVRHEAPKILPTVREKEETHKDAVAVSVGLDRTTIPMEEKVNKHRYRREAGDRRRKKPYVRRPPNPVVVNYRMGYVGTVSLIGIDGESIQTHKYGCSADADPQEVLKNMTEDLVHIQSKRKAAGLQQLPMGIIQDGAPEMWNLVEPAVARAFPGERYEKCIDRFHLMERLAESLKALRDPMLNRELQLNDWREALEKDDTAIDKIERYIVKHRNRLRKIKRLSVANAEILRSNLVYIKNNKSYMRYASLRQKGLPTGSGATEGACKSLIMIRTKGCGQRWHSRGVNSVLSLRSLYMSERLKPFWTTLIDRRLSDIRQAA